MSSFKKPEPSYDPGETVQQHVALATARDRSALPILNWTDFKGNRSFRVEGRTVVGSASGSGLVINDPTVSRLHVELDPRDDGLWVRDLGSRNGTYIEGIRVQGGRVPDGARIKIGSTIIHTSYAAERATVDVWPEPRFGPLVGESTLMRELFACLARIAPLDSSVLINGETGTGKELVARAIHEASTRAAMPFVVVDCAALPDTLLDSELFGHTRGAFTGAEKPRAGAIESAEGGTVFLDEIGELPVSMQPKLLRVIESRTVRRIGESEHRKVNVRFISATHRDLLTMVNSGLFREDLYFRLAVLPVMVPPLRDRPEDIERLVAHFLPKGTGSVSTELLRELTSRPWRGNVRELRNFIERALALGTKQALAMTTQQAPPAAGGPAPATQSGGYPVAGNSMLPTAGGPPGGAPPAGEPAMANVRFDLAFKEFREQWVDTGEREYVRRLLQKHPNVSEAAQVAGVDRTYIYRLIRKHSI